MTQPFDIDEITGRPLWRGLPVPWIVSWTGERSPQPRPLHYVRLETLDLTTGGSTQSLMLTLVDPSTHPLGFTAAAKAHRDEYGVLWYDSGVQGQGIGEPLFAQLHAKRQRACMLERRCQVCGMRFGDTPVTWLDSPAILDSDTGTRHRTQPAGTTFVTITAPTCRTCAVVAMRRCPAQKGQSRVLITGHRYRPDHVSADLYALDADGQLHMRQPHAKLAMDSPLLAMAIAKQVAVEIIDYTEEEFTP